MISMLARRLAPSVVTAATVVAGGLAVPVPTQASGSAGPSLSVPGQLNGVAAVSADAAWAAGYAGTLLRPHLLIARLTGSGWQQQPGLSSQAGELMGIAAASPSAVWAVGYSRGSSLSSTRALILRWNGSGWQRQPLPHLGYATINAVAAISAKDAWAVGFSGARIPRPVFLHWNGQSWARAHGVSGSCSMDAVAAAGPHTAWAAAECSSGGPITDKYTRGNGTSWRYVKFPLGGVYSYLLGIAAPKPADGWAVGYTASSIGSALSMRWNGRSWRRVPVPGARGRTLSAVTATATTVLAVGAVGSEKPKTLILRWRGSRWQRMRSPTPGKSASLFGVSAWSARNAWAVGCTGTLGVSEHTLILHWNGSSWASQ